MRLSKLEKSGKEKRSVAQSSTSRPKVRSGFGKRLRTHGGCRLVRGRDWLEEWRPVIRRLLTLQPPRRLQLPFPSIHHVLRSRPKICSEDHCTRLNSQFPASPCQSLPREGHFSLRESSKREWFASLPTFLFGWSHYLITSLPRLDPFLRTILMSEQALSVPQRAFLPNDSPLSCSPPSFT